MKLTGEQRKKIALSVLGELKQGLIFQLANTDMDNDDMDIELFRIRALNESEITVENHELLIIDYENEV